MKKGWSKVPLGDVLKPRSESCVLEPDEKYKEITVSLWGKGVRLRRDVLGSEIAASQRNVARQGDFIISKIDARHGAYGFIPDMLDGGVVTNDFPLFTVESQAVERRWIYWISRSQFFVELCKAASEGTTNRVRLKESKFTDLEIPLPPLPEQKRIVAHLDAIEVRRSRVQRLREDAAAESLALLRSLMNEEHCKEVRFVPMSELVNWRSLDTFVVQTESYRFAGVYSFGRGVFRKEEKAGTDFAYDRLTRLKAREFTYPKLMAWEGALGVVPENCDGCHVSPEFPVFTVDESKVLPEVLDIHFKSPSVWKKLADISTGTNLRRRRLNPNAFLGYRFPLPPMEVQQHVKRIADLAAIKRAEQKKASDLEAALLPSLLDRVFNG